MCQSREEIVSEDYVIKQAEKRLEKRGLNGPKTTKEETLENAHDIELLLYMSKEALINSKQSNQNSKDSLDLHKKFPSITYLAAKMPLFFIPLFMAFVLIIMRLSDPLELVRLASLVGIKLTADAVKESTFIVFLGLLGMSGIALAGYKDSGDEEKEKESEK